MRGILWGGGVLAICALCALTVRSMRSSSKAFAVTAKPLLSHPEQVLYGRLMRAFPGHVILAQVALSQFLVVEGVRAPVKSQSISNGFRQWVAGFVICKPDFSAVAVVELDDRSHGRTVQGERDGRKDQFLQAAGIKVIRVPVNDIPNELALRALVTTLPLNSSTRPSMRRAS
jgi:hypothetical protein